MLQLRGWTQVEHQNVYGNSSLLSLCHEQPVRVSTGPSVETHPAWLHSAGKKKKCLPLPHSAYQPISAFLNGILEREVRETAT